MANLKEAIFNDKRPIFSELKDESSFKDFKLEHSTVVWSNELDLASEYLFYVAFKDDPDLQDLFKQWGYLASWAGGSFACAVFAKADYFLTTDDKVIKKANTLCQITFLLFVSKTMITLYL